MEKKDKRGQYMLSYTPEQRKKMMSDVSKRRWDNTNKEKRLQVGSFLAQKRRIARLKGAKTGDTSVFNNNS